MKKIILYTDIHQQNQHILITDPMKKIILYTDIHQQNQHIFNYRPHEKDYSLHWHSSTKSTHF